MKNKNKINESEVVVPNAKDAAEVGKALPTAKITVSGSEDKNTDTSNTNTRSPQIPKPPIAPLGEAEVIEPESVIEPKDNAGIKYLSNVVDGESGEISKPFSIGTEKYEMVRGIGKDKKIILAVFAHNQFDDNGDNVIHSVEDFEKNIAGPMKEMMETPIKTEDPLWKHEHSKPEANDNYEGYKHYFVNKKTNEVRKFKSIKELVSNNKLDEEDYMGVKEFKQHMNEKLFGSKKRKISEDDPLGADKEPVITAVEQMHIKMDSYMDKLHTPQMKIQFIIKLTQMLNIPGKAFPLLYTELKKVSNETFVDPQSPNVTTPIPSRPETASSFSESKKITKKALIESLKPKKVNKIIKIKDIK